MRQLNHTPTEGEVLFFKTKNGTARPFKASPEYPAGTPAPKGFIGMIYPNGARDATPLKGNPELFVPTSDYERKAWDMEAQAHEQ